ncbi:MAG: hypothetical protein LBF26_01565 [Puniceicoccales bacterium]|nr:hypothetical protein [Puniceicoccales bacterium]
MSSGAGDTGAAGVAPVLRYVEMLATEARDMRARLIGESDPGKCATIRVLIDEVKTEISVTLANHQTFFAVLAAINAGQMNPDVVDYLKQAVSSLHEALERQKSEKRAPDPVVEPAILTQPESPSAPMLRRGIADRLAVAGGTTGGGAMWGAGIGACVAGPFGAAAGAGVGALAGAVVGLVSMVVD